MGLVLLRTCISGFDKGINLFAVSFQHFPYDKVSSATSDSHKSSAHECDLPRHLSPVMDCPSDTASRDQHGGSTGRYQLTLAWGN
ncbi:hypothetical protein BaRGS_00016023 [Batillaria attramentaria]|uniref:Uncharacterized protein n=1 Tax=Batillaria attramentaria TaxID=370345 RepID=A0ABD0L0B4_9CAEN